MESTIDRHRGESLLKSLARLLETSENHETRTAIVQAYSWLVETILFNEQLSARDIVVAKAIWKTSLELAASKSNTKLCKSDAITFQNVWTEVQLLKDCQARLVSQEQTVSKHTALQDLRLESHVNFILQDLSDHHDGRFDDFVQQLAAEQPRYFDRPSDCDEMLLHRNSEDDFPALNDLLLPTTFDEGTAVDIMVLLIHHVAYASTLLQQTNYDPSEEVVRALVDLRVQGVSSMLSEPLCRMPLRARQHCVAMNVWGVQEFVIHRAREILQHSPTEELTWRMYKWFVSSAQQAFRDKPGSLAALLAGYDLVPLLDPNAVPIEHFVPEVTRAMRVPADLITTWQHYDSHALEDVRFEAIGPAVNVRNIAGLTTTPDPTQCALCLDEFAGTGMPNAYEVNCGHSRHAGCLSTMVNRIEPNSNRCPLCRADICEARERRRVVESVLEDVTRGEDDID